LDLGIKNRVFIVGGATSGFGKAISLALVNEGAKVIGIARTAEKVAEIVSEYPDNFVGVSGDITEPRTLDALDEIVNICDLSGIVLNSGGPPATSALETSIDQWDEAYRNVFRWKAAMVNHFLPQMLKMNYGRILFVESYSVKQPVPNLVLSNSMRMAVTGFAKTLATEVADKGITVNILAPGFHSTPAAERVIIKRADSHQITLDQAEAQILSSIPMAHMGNPDDLGSLAAWLLSPHSSYITGQTISVDGGAILGSFG
jgi:3-oxoacyl-[acyl-carrier protein] reductase